MKENYEQYIARMEGKQEQLDKYSDHDLTYDDFFDTYEDYIESEIMTENGI